MDPLIQTFRRLVLLTLTSFILAPVWGQYERSVFKKDFSNYSKYANYDESKVPEYQLPDPLLCLDGTKVTSVKEWEEHRRPELMSMMEDYMYGHMPEVDGTFRVEVVSTDPTFRNGYATRRDIILHLTSEGPDVPVCIVVPNADFQRSLTAKNKRHPRAGKGIAPTKPMPAFLALSFNANDSIWLSPKGVEYWQPDTLLAHGYGLVTFCYTDAELDKMDDHFRSSRLHQHYYKPGQKMPLPNEWGAVACWSWTASRLMDYLEKDNLVDSSRIALLGHSRLGKTALWAGAKDSRFKVVFPVNSGSCGVALSRRCVGETVECVNRFNSQWFCFNFRQFSGYEEDIPFDQHEVVAMIAPRPVYIASAELDNWADQRGEFLSSLHASGVYNLYGKEGLVGAEVKSGYEKGTAIPDSAYIMPSLDTPLMEGNIAYHIRRGPHAVLPFDWQQFIRFADRYLK